MPTSSNTINIDFLVESTYRRDWTTTSTATYNHYPKYDAFMDYVRQLAEDLKKKQEENDLQDWEKVINSGSA